MTHPIAPVHAAFDMVEWLKAFGWGFLTFPVVYYILRVFGKQIWADIKALWAKLFAKAETEVHAYVPVIPAPVVV